MKAFWCKDSAPPHTAVGNSETNSQLGNEIHHAVGISFVSAFSKAKTEFLHSLWKADSVFALVPISLQPASRSCQHRGEFISLLPISQYRRAFISLLPISRSVDSTVAYRDNQHFNCKNFSVPWAKGLKMLPTGVCSGLKAAGRSVRTIGNLLPNCKQPYEMTQ